MQLVAIFLLVLLKVYAQNMDKPDYPAHVGLEQNQYFKTFENRFAKNEEEIKSLEERIEKSESGYRDVQVRLNKPSLTSEISAISARLDTEIRVGLNYSAQLEMLENRFKVIESGINSLNAKVEHLDYVNNLTSNILVINRRLGKLDTEIEVGQKHPAQLKRVEERVRVLESGMNSINLKLDTDAFTKNFSLLISKLTGRINRIESRTAPYPSSGIWLLYGKSNDWKRISGSPCTHGVLNIANSTTAVLWWISSVPETCHLLVSFESTGFLYTPLYEYKILDSNCVDNHVTIMSLSSEANSSGKLCSHGTTVKQRGYSSLLVFHSNSIYATVNIKLKIQVFQVYPSMFGPNTEVKSFAHILSSDKWGLTVPQTQGITWERFSTYSSYVTALITQSDIRTLGGRTELIWEITNLNIDCTYYHSLGCYDIGRMKKVGLVPSIWGRRICGNNTSIPANYRTLVGLVCTVFNDRQGSGYAGRITKVPRLTPSI